jgi:hypothetical protein
MHHQSNTISQNISLACRPADAPLQPRAYTACLYAHRYTHTRDSSRSWLKLRCWLLALLPENQGTAAEKAAQGGLHGSLRRKHGHAHEGRWSHLQALPRPGQAPMQSGGRRLWRLTCQSAVHPHSQALSPHRPPVWGALRCHTSRQQWYLGYLHWYLHCTGICTATGSDAWSHRPQGTLRGLMLTCGQGVIRFSYSSDPLSARG